MALRTTPDLGALAQEVLAALSAKDRLRTLSPTPSGLRADLTHNDYLHLRDDAELHAAALAHAQELPFGAGASRLLGGEHPIFRTLEQAFAAFKGTPDALYFASGYAANEALLSTLSSLPGVAVFSDALNHASLIDGIRLGGLPKERRIVFPHLDLVGLERALAQSDAAVKVVVVESLYSMDGDVAPLAALLELATRYRGVLVVDEAHANFCLGPQGKGLVAAARLDPTSLPSVITIDTCGKAMAAQGAFVCGPAWLRHLLINRARSFIYTTAPSPWIAAALLAVIDASPRYEARRARLATIGTYVREKLRAKGLSLGPTSSHVIPVIFGSDAAALAAAEGLAARGFRARAVRPPTVPEGTARVRLSLHSALTDADVDALIEAFP